MRRCSKLSTPSRTEHLLPGHWEGNLIKDAFNHSAEGSLVGGSVAAHSGRAERHCFPAEYPNSKTTRRQASAAGLYGSHQANARFAIRRSLPRVLHLELELETVPFRVWCFSRGPTCRSRLQELFFVEQGADMMEASTVLPSRSINHSSPDVYSLL